MARVPVAILLVLIGTSIGKAAALTDEKGINSAVTGLDGSKAIIGQIELARAGDPDVDISSATGMPIPELITPGLNPAAVFFGTQNATSAFLVDDHANQVAEVMVGTGGVATGAKLYSGMPGGGDEPMPAAIAAMGDALR